MTKQVQRRRGTATQHTSFTGAEGEISVNTTNKSVHVHDGVTAGGIEGARADLTNVSDSDLNARLTGNTLSSLTITSADINGGTIDGTVIGGTTPAAGSFTTGSFTGNVSFGDNDKAIFGAGSDLQIYHDGSNSFIKDLGTGSLYLEGQNHVYIRGAGDGSTLARFSQGAQSELYHAGTKTLNTTSTGIDVTGTVTADGLTVDGADTEAATSQLLKVRNSSTGEAATIGLYAKADNGGDGNAGSITFDAGADGSAANNELRFSADHQTDTNPALSIAGNGDISFYEDTGTTAQMVWDASADALTFGDNVKAIFGAGSDLQIYHTATGNHSIINESGGGDLQIQANKTVIQSASGADDFLVVTPSAGVELSHNAGGTVGVKLATTSTGIDVTGTVTADGLTVDGDSEFNGLFEINNTSVRVDLMETDATDLNGRIQNTGGTLRLNTLVDDKSSQKIRLSVDHSTGDISFFEDTGTTPKFHWSASAESLGIGTSGNSPWGTTLSSLRLGSSGSVAAHSSSDATYLSSNAYYTDGWRYVTNDAASNIELNGNNGDIRFNVAPTGTAGASFSWSEAMRLAPSGNVGIGTSSPSANLHVEASGTNPYIRVTETGNTGIDFGQETNGNGLINLRDSAALRVFTSGTERLRIDSSGAVMMGKTSTSVADAGLVFSAASDYLGLTRDGGAALFVNRIDSDGSIVEFRKDNVAVGSIGTTSSNTYIGTGATGLRFYDAGSAYYPIRPDTVATRDNAIDLGVSFARFKDLYLSGGVYLGGTGAANKLDDYEEGTFTPTLNNGTVSVGHGSWVKIGNLVTVTITLGNFSDWTSGTLTCNNMPFVSKSGDAYQAHGAVMHQEFNIANAQGITAFMNDGTSSLVWYANQGSSSWTAVKNSDIDTPANAYLRTTITYRTV